MANLAAIYARVSTNEQTTENQVMELEALAAQRGLTIIQIYEDKGYSGKTDQRPAFQSMIKDAVSGRFNVLLCWHIDRLGRSLVDVVNTVQSIQAANVELILQQQSIDTTTPVGKAMLSMCAVFAELELSMMKERLCSDSSARCSSTPGSNLRRIATLLVPPQGMISTTRPPAAMSGSSPSSTAVASP